MQEHYLPKNYRDTLGLKTDPRILCITNASSYENFQDQYLSHSHDFLELCYISEGHGFININGDEYEISPGSIAIYNTGIRHDEHFEKKTDYNMYSIDIDDFYLTGLSPNCLIYDDIVPVFSFGHNSEHIDSIIKILWEISNSSSPQSICLCHNLCMTILSTLKASQHNKKVLNIQSNICRKVQTYINENYSQKISVEQLAQHVSTSPFHLSRVYKATTGYTINEYLTRVRIGHAQELLIHTKLPITEIAYAIGYGNHSYFTQLFYKKFHLTPLQFRKMHNNSLNHT